MQALDVKQGLTQNFVSTTERDEWIQKAVKSKEASRKKHLQQAKEAQAQIKALEMDCASLNKVSPCCKQGNALDFGQSHPSLQLVLPSRSLLPWRHRS